VTAHVTPADVAAFRARTLDRAGIEAIGAHMRECSECTRVVFGDPGIAESVQSAWTPEPSSRRWLLPAFAAVAAFVAIGLGVWTTRDGRRGEDVDTTTAPGTGVVLVARLIHDGSVAITLDGHGAVKDVSTSRPEWNDLAMTALRTGQLPVAARVDLTTPGVVLRGDDSDAPRVRLLEPAGETVESDRPEFRWSPVPRARYRVVVARDGRIVAKSELLSGTRWQPPQPLRRGEVYAWQLAVVAGDREWTFPSPEDPAAQFHVLGADAAHELQAARERDSRLVLGLVAARHGLDDLAERELSAFADAHPGIANAAKLAEAAKTQERPAPTTTKADQ
jgi:hypothetical protein